MKPGTFRWNPLRELRRAVGAYPLFGYLGFSLRSRWFAGTTVLFFPQPPGPLSVEFKLCRLLGYSATGDPNRRFDVAFKRQAATFFDPAVLGEVGVELERIVNSGSLDISKRTVATAFAAAFGYPLAVDPTRHSGPMVEKSDRNWTHDGRVITGPIDPREVRPGKVYQKAIDGPAKDGLIVDYRVPVHGERIPLVYVQHVPARYRFSRRAYARVDVVEPALAFSAMELEAMLRLAGELGLDYGEFDVLRDRRDGLAYVVDANNTPSGPPWELSRSERRSALERLAESFDRLLRSRALSDRLAAGAGGNARAAATTARSPTPAGPPR